jgi:hypothetical protein
MLGRVGGVGLGQLVLDGRWHGEDDGSGRRGGAGPLVQFGMARQMRGRSHAAGQDGALGSGLEREGRRGRGASVWSGEAVTTAIGVAEGVEGVGYGRPGRRDGRKSRRRGEGAMAMPAK